ncbi:hypothetical protein PYCC9005_005243 [Savitreella phatthalungensis]
MTGIEALKLPPVTRAYVGASAILTLAHKVFKISLLDQFVLRLGDWHNVWALYTTSFFADDLPLFCFGVLTTAIAGRYLERAWGSRELFKYYVVVGCLSTLVCFVFTFIVYAITRKSRVAAAPISGDPHLQVATFIALKQLVPEHRVALLRNRIKFRLKRVPFAHLSFICLYCSIWEHDYDQAALAVIGFFTGWAYLRYFKVHADLDVELQTVGDQSDTFSLADLLPESLADVVKAIERSIAARLGRRTSQALSSPAIDRTNEADRRRARALEALSAS